MTYPKFLKELRKLPWVKRDYIKQQAKYRYKDGTFGWSNPISLVCVALTGKLHHGSPMFAADEINLPREIAGRIMRALRDIPEDKKRKVLLTLS